jgi:hypothetical protein
MRSGRRNTSALLLLLLVILVLVPGCSELLHELVAPCCQCCCVATIGQFPVVLSKLVHQTLQVTAAGQSRVLLLLLAAAADCPGWRHLCGATCC